MSPWTPLIAATAGWAISAVFTRAVLVTGVDAFTLVPLRMAFALVTLLVIVIVSGRFRTTSSAAWGRGALLGVAAMAVPMLLLTLALQELPVSLGGMLIALIPISTMVAANFLLKDEPFRARSLPGLFIALAGSALLVGIGGETVVGVGNLWRGVGFSLLGVITAGLGGALTRRFAQDVPSNDLVLPQFTINTLILFAGVPTVFGVNVSAIDGGAWLMIAAVGVVGTTLPFAAFIIAASMNSATRLGLTGYAVPVVAVTLAVLFLGETLTPALVAGAVLIVSGVVITDRSTRHTPVPGVFESR